MFFFTNYFRYRIDCCSLCPHCATAIWPICYFFTHGIELFLPIFQETQTKRIMKEIHRKIGHGTWWFFFFFFWAFSVLSFKSLSRRGKKGHYDVLGSDIVAKALMLGLSTDTTSVDLTLLIRLIVLFELQLFKSLSVTWSHFKIITASKI